VELRLRAPLKREVLLVAVPHEVLRVVLLEAHLAVLLVQVAVVPQEEPPLVDPPLLLHAVVPPLGLLPAVLPVLDRLEVLPVPVLLGVLLVVHPEALQVLVVPLVAHLVVRRDEAHLEPDPHVDRPEALQALVVVPPEAPPEGHPDAVLLAVLGVPREAHQDEALPDAVCPPEVPVDPPEPCHRAVLLAAAHSPVKPLRLRVPRSHRSSVA